MTENLNESGGRAAVWAGGTTPELRPISEILGEARGIGITIDPASGEDVSDLVPKGATGGEIWARYNAKRAFGLPPRKVA